MPDLPGPEETKSLTMPGDRRRGLDDVQCRAPVARDPGEEHPKQTVDRSQLRPFPGRTLKDPDLVAERDVLQLQHSARTEHRAYRRQEGG
jgi:hypothetical protein